MKFFLTEEQESQCFKYDINTNCTYIPNFICSTESFVDMIFMVDTIEKKTKENFCFVLSKNSVLKVEYSIFKEEETKLGIQREYSYQDIRKQYELVENNTRRII